MPPAFADGQGLAILGLKGVSVKYKIALQKTDEGYAVSVPGLPGCWSQGATESEALGNIRDAIGEYLAAREELLLVAFYAPAPAAQGDQGRVVLRGFNSDLGMERSGNGISVVAVAA